MRHIESLVEAYILAERDLVAALDASGGAVPLPDGRTVTVGRAEFDALLGERRKRAWVIIRRKTSMPGAAVITDVYGVSGEVANWGAWLRHKKKARKKSRAFVNICCVGLVVHTAHATARHSRSPTVLLRPFGDHGFRGD
jgi:hypothetical protein